MNRWRGEQRGFEDKAYLSQLAHFPVNENTFFRQKGATSHTASMNTVNALFSGRVISGNGDIPYHRILKACDFFYGDT